MRKIIALLTAVALVGLCGCTSQTETSDNRNNTSQSAILQAEKKVSAPSFEQQFKWAEINATIKREEYFGYRTDNDGGLYITAANNFIYHIKGDEITEDKSATMTYSYRDFLTAEQCKTLEGIVEGNLRYFSDEIIITQKVTSGEILVTDFSGKKTSVSFDKKIDNAFIMYDRIWVTVYNEELTNVNSINGLCYDIYSFDFNGKDLKKHTFTVSSEMYFVKSDKNILWYFYDPTEDTLKCVDSADKVPQMVMNAPEAETKCDQTSWHGIPVNGTVYYVTSCITKLDITKYSYKNDLDTALFPTKSSGRVYIQKDGKLKLVYTDRNNQAIFMFADTESFYVVFYEATNGTKFVRRFNLDGKMIKEYNLTIKTAALFTK